eukprot:gb/GFBE01030939.1/.p1 GENE.gb/GFBE01030939.1/~~gb/GFBE01030939.1/.p1  ORF type:complete len:335 (+),score=56.60 gb/GFBE01030939.1/:1-1005(+)
MWLLSLGLCRRRCHLPCAHRCQWWVRKRLPKEKEAESDGEDDVEKGADTCPDISENKVQALASALANGQDADELGAGTRLEVPSWQIPELIVECSQRPGARIHKGTSLILPEAGGDLLASIVGNLPVLLQIRPRWVLGYSMAVDGVSLRTMYRQLADAGPCVVIVEDSSNCIFGAFLSEGLRPVSQCYGTHECFVFRTPRTAGAWRTEVYGRTVPQTSPRQELQDGPGSPKLQQELEEAQRNGEQQAAQSFSSEKAGYFEDLRKSQGAAQESSSASVFCNHMGIVVGIDGPALFVDQDLLRGVSWPSAGFGSPCLASAGTDFVVRNLEVWHWAA